jgi:hypothetical protein
MNIKCSFIIFYKTWLKLNTETGHEISMLNYEPPNKKKHAQHLNLFFPPPKKNFRCSPWQLIKKVFIEHNQHRSRSTLLAGYTEVCSSAAEAKFFYLYHLDSSFSVHVCYPRGVLPTYWACRVFSGFRD